MTTTIDPTSDPSEAEKKIEEGTALCLSGGGYRAMLFHCGALIRLNELGALGRLKRISSVSGGSITAGMLGLRWEALKFNPTTGVANNLREQVIDPIYQLAGHSIDVGSILGGMFLPGVDISDRIEAAYRKHLFGNATLQDLPDDATGPRFVVNATSVQTGVLFRFSRPYAGDYLLGRIEKPTISLAEAVAASSAFPPFLSPATITPGKVSWIGGEKRYETMRERIVLSDGGVYDNLGLETAFKRYKTLIVSDGGQPIAPETEPNGDWGRHAVRVLHIVDNQVRSLRKRLLLDAFRSGQRSGTYFGMRTPMSAYSAKPTWSVEESHARALADTPTRLAELEPAWRERLINYGFLLSDAAYRTHVAPSCAPPNKLPYPSSGV